MPSAELFICLNKQFYIIGNFLVTFLHLVVFVIIVIPSNGNAQNILKAVCFTVCSRKAEISSKNQYQGLFDIAGICIGCQWNSLRNMLQANLNTMLKLFPLCKLDLLLQLYNVFLIK